MHSPSQKRRGALEEGGVLDGLAARRGEAIGARNDAYRVIVTECYSLGGRIDGRLGGGGGGGDVVEVKTRRSWFARGPPEYDVIQLRCYLRCFGARRGLLVEKQQVGA